MLQGSSEIRLLRELKQLDGSLQLDQLLTRLRVESGQAQADAEAKMAPGSGVRFSGDEKLRDTLGRVGHVSALSIAAELCSAEGDGVWCVRAEQEGSVGVTLRDGK